MADEESDLEVIRDPLEWGRAQRLELRCTGRRLRWSEVVEGWRTRPGFCHRFSRAIAEAPFDALLWETPPLSRPTADQPFSQVLVDSPALAAVQADPRPFAEHFGTEGPPVRTFPNLGGDAVLVVPTPTGRTAPYPHLAAYLRAAPSDRIHAFWQALGDAVHRHLARTVAPVWVSTSGLGVHWVHARLDRVPKYYTHRPFRVPPRPET